ncbi:MAG: hypothetical protein Q7R33_03700 [Nitrosarchaeum sp.]|nr:hypothetical protein [Nitrosarchaeum sp.]
MKDSNRKAMFAKKWGQASGSSDIVTAKLKSDGGITPIPKNIHEFADKTKLVTDTEKVVKDEKKVVKDIEEDAPPATVLKDEKKAIKDTKQVIKDEL